MDQLMMQVVVFCIVSTIVSLWLGVYLKNQVFKIFPDIEENKGMLGFGSEYLIFDKSVPRFIQNLYLASRFVFLLSTICGLASSMYFNNQGWMKVFVLPVFYSAYNMIVSLRQFFKCNS